MFSKVFFLSNNSPKPWYTLRRFQISLSLFPVLLIVLIVLASVLLTKPPEMGKKNSFDFEMT
jgi:hypothetical protein